MSPSLPLARPCALPEPGLELCGTVVIYIHLPTPTHLAPVTGDRDMSQADVTKSQCVWLLFTGTCG